jgi:hypothetical protein
MTDIQAMVFSRKPYGALWVCGTCDRVHARFGDCILMFPPEILARWADADAVEAAVCPESHCLHLVCGQGQMHIPGEHLVGFQKAAAGLHDRLRFPMPSQERLGATSALRH